MGEAGVIASSTSAPPPRPMRSSREPLRARLLSLARRRKAVLPLLPAEVAGSALRPCSRAARRRRARFRVTFGSGRLRLRRRWRWRVPAEQVALEEVRLIGHRALEPLAY